MRLCGVGLLSVLMLLAGCRRHETVEIPFAIGTRQVTLSGTVSDALSRAPLSGARVVAATFVVVGTTAADGGYMVALEVSGLQSQLEVIAERTGYTTRRINVSTSATRLDIEMQPAAGALR